MTTTCTNILWLIVLLALSSITIIHSQNCTQAGQLRLLQTASFRGSNFSSAGRVEICIGEVWGTIAADSIATPWSEKNAQVACIQLGFSGALNAIFQRTIPFDERSTSPIHLSAVECNGTESSIMDCRYSTSTQNLNHGSDVYIVCRPRGFRYSLVHPSGPQSGDIRLFGDVRNGHGAVQIYTTTLGWQGICPDDSWSNGDAATVCRDLGYDGGSVATPVDAVRVPGGGHLTRNLYDAKCPGIPADDVITDVCSFRIPSSPANCASPEGRFAAVQCSYAFDQSVRLIGGSHYREGIVEIAYNGRWGMMCNGGFQSVDARSTCQGLGFGTDKASVMSVSSTSQILESESNLRPIWLNNLECISSDQNLPSCIREQNIIGYANCITSSIAAVDCGDPPPLTPGQIAGIVIGVLVFLAIVIPLLVICLDENKKKATIAKLNAAKARITNFRCQCRCRCPRLPHCQPRCQCPRLPRRQPRPQPVAPTTELSAQQPPFPEPSGSEPANNNQALEESNQDIKGDLPPPYPGGLGYPPPFTASVNYQGYPPPWSDPAYPPDPTANNPN